MGGGGEGATLKGSYKSALGFFFTIDLREFQNRGSYLFSYQRWISAHPGIGCGWFSVPNNTGLSSLMAAPGVAFHLMSWPVTPAHSPQPTNCHLYTHSAPWSSFHLAWLALHVPDPPSLASLSAVYLFNRPVCPPDIQHSSHFMVLCIPNCLLPVTGAKYP